MYTKTVKFGGSSLADATQFQKVAAIIRGDEARRFVVVSAPGKRFSGDTKVTDMLYRCYDEASAGKDFSETLSAIRTRYNGIVSELGLSLSLDGDFEDIRASLAQKPNRDYTASRGEYLNGRVMAAYLGFEFVDPAGYVFFDEKGAFLADKTN